MTIIVVGQKTYTTSLEPTHAAEDHGHDELPMDDSNLKDGQIKLKANPPPDGKYIWVQKDNADQFTVETDGFVKCRTLESAGGVETLDNALINIPTIRKRMATIFELVDRAIMEILLLV